MRDRLSEVRQSAGVTAEDVAADAELLQEDYELETGSFLPEFYEHVGQIRRTFKTIEDNMGTIQSHMDAALAAYRMEQSQAATEQLDALIAASRQLLRGVGDRLRSMDAENKELIAEYRKQESGHVPDATDKAEESGAAVSATISDADLGNLPADLRVRVTIHRTLSKKFFGYLTRFQQMQYSTKEQLKGRVKRVLRMVDSQLTDTQIDEVFESGDQQLVLRAHIAGGSEAQLAYSLAKERHTDIVRLTRSIAELHSMVTDFAFLVETQSEMVDQIEYNVHRAKVYTEEAIIQIDQGMRSHKRTRRSMCLLTLILIIITIVCLFSTIKAAIFSM
jgi:syntaxin 1A/syntaxin 1B/2/3|eukprot:gnl/Ergobibamus_cyprinoides/333.p1 GENE.gnl/Ergobibamus_cyprinoides/333~~gnl/Ergobibamus_cyprinoides/333.p1  ORF type:complete len:334 (+),score=128.64 gnl/Ergobibamus_cyprinoides/333:99-1100(+)